MRVALAAVLGLAVWLVSQAGHAADPVGQSVALPEARGPHWVWVADALLRRAALVDGDTGAFLGQVPGGTGIIAPIFSRDGRELYLAETHYARATRGARTDVVSIADARTLAPQGEVVIPAKRSEHTSWVGGSALSDDGRFLAVFNLNPATSLSIVDMAERRFVGEIDTPGCSLVYAAGPRRFFSLCADGTALLVKIDESGAATKAKSERFFDPDADPVMEKPVRRGDEWLFVSFAGKVHGMDVSGPAFRFAEPWALAAEAAEERGWRPGGMQPLALHAASGRLFVLMHEGGADTHKQPGTEVWAFDLAKRERAQRIALRGPAAAFVLEQLEQEPGGALDWLLQRALPNEGVERIAVTQDDEPLLFAATGFPSTLAVYDANTGAHLRDVREVGVATSLIQLP
jgi:methylamine dehydrogenase heavy chain